METLIRRSIQVGLLAAPLLFLGTAAQGHGGDQSLIHACVHKRDGDVRVVGAREGCHRSERALHWVREVPPPAPAPAPSGAAAAEVVDSANVVLGPVVGMSGLFPVVGVRKDGLTFPFVVANQSPSLFGFDNVYFTGPSCDGTAYLIRSLSPFPTTAVDQNGNGYGDGGQPALLVSVNSFAASDGSCWMTAWTTEMAPATLVFTQGTFLQPFRVR
jgi:hypothetical protein